jgi:flagellar biosynthetic protein FliO
MIVAVALLCAAAWLLLRWRRRSGAGRRQLRVLDRAFLSRGASVALVHVAGKRLLLGVTTEGVRLLRDLDPGVAATPADFQGVLAAATARRKTGS